MSDQAWRTEAGQRALPGAGPPPDTPELPLWRWTLRALIVAAWVGGLLLAMNLAIPCATSFAFELAGLLVMLAAGAAGAWIGCRWVWRRLMEPPS